MALINCPECDKEISDTVKRCPHCGYKMQKKKQKNSLTKSKKIVIVGLGVVVLAVCGCLVYQKVIVPSYKYSAAEKTLSNGEYDKAISQFEELANYKDSEDRILEVYYEKGNSLYTKQSYSEAIDAYKKANDYEDSEDKIEEAENEMEIKAAADAYKRLVQNMVDAYAACISSNTSLSSDGLSITVDSINNYDDDSVKDILTIISKLGISDSLIDEMSTTTAMMGRQSEVYGNYEVSWSYHPDNGLDAVFQVK